MSIIVAILYRFKLCSQQIIVVGALLRTLREARIAPTESIDNQTSPVMAKTGDAICGKIETDSTSSALIHVRVNIDKLNISLHS